MVTLSQLNLLSTTTTSAEQTAAQAASSASPVTAALKKADARIQAQLDTTNAQLSSLGKLKSAVSDIQASAHVMRSMAASASMAPTDIKSAVNRFVTAFNTGLGAAKAVSTAMTSSDASGANRVSNDLSRSFSSSGAFDALQKMGFKQLADGSLKIDPAKLDAALKADPASVQATLGKLGQATDTIATKELAAGGHVATPLASLNQRASALKDQHSAMVAMAQNLNASSSAQNTSYLSYGISAYKSNA